MRKIFKSAREKLNIFMNRLREIYEWQLNPQYVHNKLVDLEDRSSSNNLRIYGIKGKEGRIEDWEDCEAEVEKRFREKLQAFTKYLRQTLAFA